MIRFLCLICLSFACLFAAGCSCAYHAYTCGCVPLDYVAPAPLPYAQCEAQPSTPSTKSLQTAPLDGAVSRR